jgi:formate dehydrogenase alpha subunit
VSGPRAEIDGVAVELLPGDTLLDAARRAGVRIPTLCHVEGLAPDGGCRVCLVEVAGAARPLAACHTPAQAGMRIETATSRLAALRRGVLELWRDSLPGESFAGGTREFAALLEEHDLAAAGAAERADAAAHPHPYLRFDAARCITCRRCLHACEDVQGQFVYGIEGRGAATRLVFGETEAFLETECTACGACIELCPTGALWDSDAEGHAESKVRSTCGYCGVGCGVEVHVEGARVLRVRGAADSPVNRGHLCAKGRYAHGWQRSPERLTRPLLREGEGFREIAWDEATHWLARRLREIRDARGPGALGALSSSRSTNEAAYLLQKLFRAVLGTNHVDCCARVCHSSTALALREVTGTSAASASYADIERARCIAVVGANPTEAHPVVGARIKQAALRGAKLIVIDPRRIELVDQAEHHLALRAGTNVALFNALARLLIDAELHDAAYVAERCQGFDALAAHLSETSVEAAARLCGLEPQALREAARALAGGPVLFVHGLGLSELTQGTASVMALANLAMLTGSIGRPGAGVLPLRGQNNVQGNADMGGMPNLVTGYQRLDSPEVRERLRREWGACPPEAPGLTIPEMFEAARAGQVAGLWIQGEDVAQSDPDQTRVIEALESLELLVVQELFPSETSRFAHLVLPAAGVLEQDGTFTNAERRIQRVRRAVAPPGEARPDWEAVRDVANALGAGWSYEHPGQVMDEVARVAPALFGGVSYARLEGEGLQWPCPDPSHPGTASVHADGFLRGKGQLALVDFAETPEAPGGDHPYLLITGRVLQHYNVGTMTRRTPSQQLAAVDALEIHPDDAAREGLADGDRVVLESRWGKTEVQVAVSRRMTRGSLFLSFHHPETHANRVTSPHRDPRSNCPEYKVTAVRLAPA